MSVSRSWSERRRRLIRFKVARWKLLTPGVLQRAIHAGWNRTSTPAQSALLSHWVISRVMNEPIPDNVWVAAIEDERKRRPVCNPAPEAVKETPHAQANPKAKTKAPTFASSLDSPAPESAED